MGNFQKSTFSSPPIIMVVLTFFSLFHLSVEDERAGLVSERLVLPGGGQVRPPPPFLAESQEIFLTQS